jgi:hypothetical protein
MPDTAEESAQVPTGLLLQEDGVQTPDEDEKPRTKPIGRGRAILISTLVVLTQLIQASRLRATVLDLRFMHHLLTRRIEDDPIRRRYQWLVSYRQSRQGE